MTEAGYWRLVAAQNRLYLGNPPPRPCLGIRLLQWLPAEASHRLTIWLLEKFA